MLGLPMVVKPPPAPRRLRLASAHGPSTVNLPRLTAYAQGHPDVRHLPVTDNRPGSASRRSGKTGHRGSACRRSGSACPCTTISSSRRPSMSAVGFAWTFRSGPRAFSCPLVRTLAHAPIGYRSESAVATTQTAVCDPTYCSVKGRSRQLIGNRQSRGLWGKATTASFNSLAGRNADLLARLDLGGFAGRRGSVFPAPPASPPGGCRDRSDGLTPSLEVPGRQCRQVPPARPPARFLHVVIIGRPYTQEQP